MSEFIIIEDSSPFYIRFTHNGIDKLVERCRQYTDPNLKYFSHYRLPEQQAQDILSLTPISKHIPFELARVSLFISAPGLYYRAHKDGIADRFSINYPITILDDKCVTSWYADEDLKNYQIDTLNGNSRECINFDRTKHTPLKSMIAKPGECILFNTDIFHDWNNVASTNIRTVLTLRIKISSRSKTYFKDARKIIFGY